MAAIDVGSSPIDRATYWSGNHTTIAAENPANDTGVLTLMKVFMKVAASQCELATFINVGGHNFTTRAWQAVGALGVGYSEHAVNIAVVTGDYIGMFFYDWNADCDFDTFGAGVWDLGGDQVPCVNVTFNWSPTRTLSLWAEGATTGWGGKISGVSAPAKVMGIDVGNIVEVKGVT